MQEYVFIGTYTQTKSKGIYGCVVEDGKINEIRLLAERESPTYLAVNQAGTVLYAVDEPDEGPGTLGSYRILRDQEGRVEALSLQNSLVAPSLGICHLVLSPDEKYLLVTSYFDAKVQVYSLGEKGELLALTDCIQHQGQGPNPLRQEGAHAHSITYVPDKSFFYVCDLGQDALVAYRLSDEGKLIAIPENNVQTPAGYGPRHMVFSRDGRYAYVVAEIVNHLLVYRFEDGKMTLLEDHLSTEKQDPANTGAAVRVSRDGRFVYISNRGEDTLTVYEIGEEGRLIKLQRIVSEGKTPRELALSLDEAYVYVGNQDSDTFVIFRRDAISGILSLVATTDQIGQPVCAVSTVNGMN